MNFLDEWKCIVSRKSLGSLPKDTDSKLDCTVIMPFENLAGMYEQKQDQSLEKISEMREEYPLTEAQMGIYIEYISNQHTVMYNIPMFCELPGQVNKARFIKAVKKAVAMHLSFGVNIVLSNGSPRMRLHPEYLHAQVKELETDDIERVKKTFVRPFPLDGNPLYRMALYQCRGRFYFLFDVHRMIFDNTSVNLFLHEISLLYQKKEPMPEELSMLDVAVYEESLKKTTKYQLAREYFKGKLSGKEFGETLIRDYRKQTAGCKGGIVTMALGEEFSRMAVKQFVRQKGISEHTLFLSAFAFALGKYGGGSKSCFCAVNDGRRTASVTKSVGMFGHTLPVCCSWKESSPVENYLLDFQEMYYELMQHDCISFSELAKDYGITPDILFVYQGELLSGLEIEQEQCKVQYLPLQDAKADIAVMVRKKEEGYEISLEYRLDLYKKETALGLLGMLHQVLSGMLYCETLAQIPLAI